MLKYLVKNLESWGIGAVFGVMVFLLLNVAMGRDILPGARRTFEPIEPPVIELDPERLYMSTCASCHQANGQGLPGQFPPLAESSWVTGDPETVIRIVLLGLTGPVEVQGTVYNGVMPAQGHLNDEQIANVVSYVRTNFGNDAGEVDPALVAEVRAALAGRTDPLQGGAELSTLRSQ